MQFTDLSLISPLLRAVSEAGYQSPSPIQQQAIPPVLAGRDLLGCAQTGTGKTAAFALPILQLLAQRKPAQKKAIRALILTPTRELALQIQESFEAYGKHLPLRSTVIFGGVGQAPQVAQLRRGVDVLVATPGRLHDLIGQGYIHLQHVEIFVLDEADRMLDMGFVQDVKKVLRFLPKKRQTLLFSATMPPEIVELADTLLHKPAKVFVTPPATTVESIEQCLYKVDKANKRKLLASLLRDPQITSALVFTRTKHGADRVVRELSKEGITAMAIHGNKSQNARQQALARLKDGKMQVLVATDIAARGLDISELSHVFNYDLPNIPETYVHRIGRTGRAGRGGKAVSFCMCDELPYLKDIEKLIGFPIPEMADHPWPMQVFNKKAEKQAAGQRGEAARPLAAAEKGRAAARGKKTLQKPLRTAEPKANAATAAAKAAPAQSKAKKGQPLAAKPVAPGAPAPMKTTAGRPAKRLGRRPIENNPYENLTGGKAIVTKRPVWGNAAGEKLVSVEKGEEDMNRNNRRRSNKNRNRSNEPKAKPEPPPKEKLPEIPKDEHGIFDFSEAELAEDKGLRVVSRNTGETKYASFEDFLKDQ